jgi:uncharacterized Fe-S cluster protein YjdI
VNVIDNTEKCVHCKQTIVGDSTIFQGRAWHRKCYEDTHRQEVKRTSLPVQLPKTRG